MLKIGCIDNIYSSDPETSKIVVKLPTFKHSVIWTLTDPSCSKMMGYHPQLQAPIVKEDPNL